MKIIVDRNKLLPQLVKGYFKDNPKYNEILKGNEIHIYENDDQYTI